MLESARSYLIPYAKCLDTLDLGECCDALFYLPSRYLLNNNELMVLSALLSIIITYMCPCLGCKHWSPVTTPAFTSGENSSPPQVLPKGLVVRVLLVCCCSGERLPLCQQ